MLNLSLTRLSRIPSGSFVLHSLAITHRERCNRRTVHIIIQKQAKRCDSYYQSRSDGRANRYIRYLSVFSLSFDGQMSLYWLGDLTSLNLVPSTMDSEPPISPNKNPNPYFPQTGCRMAVCRTLGFAPYGDPNSHLYIIQRYYPLGLGLVSCRTPLILRLRVPAPHVTTPPIVPPTSGKTRLYTTCTSLSSRSRHSSPQRLN